MEKSKGRMKFKRSKEREKNTKGKGCQKKEAMFEVDRPGEIDFCRTRPQKDTAYLHICIIKIKFCCTTKSMHLGGVC